MNTSRNNLVLERLQSAYSAVLELSSQGFEVEAIDIHQLTNPKLTVTRESYQPSRKSSAIVGAGMRGGCEILMVERGR